MIDVTTYKINTGMGFFNSGDRLDFLSDKERDEFDNIGYSGKTLDGKRTTRQDYLNSLNKGKFTVQQTKSDNGDFTEQFLIVRIIITE